MSDVISGQGNDSLTAGVLKFIQGLRQDKRLMSIVHNIPFLEPALQMVSRLLVSFMQRILPKLVERHGSVAPSNKTSVDVLLDSVEGS